VQPAAYLSPSGRFELLVDPSRRTGRGEGRYAMRRDGDLLWERTLPTTFEGAVVADDGSAGGFGVVRRGDEAWLALVVLDPAGGIRAEHLVRRFEQRLPGSAGRDVMAAGASMVVWSWPQEGSGWRFWVVDLLTGEQVDAFDPAERFGLPGEPLLAALGLPDSPLLVTAWSTAPGRRYLVTTLAGERVWEAELEVRGAYEDLASNVRRWLRIEAEREDAVLDLGGGSFGWHDPVAEEHAAFRVRPASSAPSGWEVEPLARTPHRLRRPGERPPGTGFDRIPALDLEPLGELPLDPSDPPWDIERRFLLRHLPPEGRWEMSVRWIRRFHPDGGVTEIERGPDGRWLVGLECGDVGRDGSLAVLRGRPYQVGPDAGLLVLGPDGGFRLAVANPGWMTTYGLAYDGRTVALLGREWPKDPLELVLLDAATGEPLGRIAPRAGRELWDPRIEDGELRVHDGDRIVRYAIPDRGR